VVAATDTDSLEVPGCRDTRRLVLDLVHSVRGFGTANVEPSPGLGTSVVSAWLLFFCARTTVLRSTLSLWRTGGSGLPAISLCSLAEEFQCVGLGSRYLLSCSLSPE
jgi:hypothetical protein